MGFFIGEKMTLLGKHIKSLLKAIPKYNIRYYLNGLYVNFDLKEIVVTNGHILVLLENLEELDLDGTGEVIIPRKVIEAATSVCDLKAPVKITNSEFSIGDLTIRYQPIEYKFPDIRHIFPKEEVSYNDSRFCWFQSNYVKVVEEVSKVFDVLFKFFPPKNTKGGVCKLTGISCDTSTVVTMLLAPCDVDINGKEKT